MKFGTEKEAFTTQLKAFANSLAKFIAYNDEWTIRGFRRSDLFRFYIFAVVGRFKEAVSLEYRPLQTLFSGAA